MRIDKQQGLIALGRFKSCVRTSLLLCGGYECQEKEGTFMIAFPHPRTAVEWALTLQLALLRYAATRKLHDSMASLTQLCFCIQPSALPGVKILPLQCAEGADSGFSKHVCKILPGLAATEPI